MVGHRLAEALAGGLVREGGRRRQVGDRHRRLQGPARRQDLAPDGEDRLGRQRTAVARGESTQNRGLPLRDIRRRILPSFEVSDLEGGLGALVEEVENLVIEFADPGAPIAQVHRDSCARSLLSIGHYRRTLAAFASNQRASRTRGGGAAAAAARSAASSRVVRGRQAPTGSAPSATGPKATRRSRFTRW